MTESKMSETRNSSHNDLRVAGEEAASGVHVTSATRDIFHALDIDGSNSVSSSYLATFLGKQGLLPDDARLAGLFDHLRSLDAIDNDRALTLEEFDASISTCSTLVHKAVTGDLRVPDFENLTRVMEEVYREVEPNTGGANADYIPQLAAVNPDQFAISICTVDGQRFSVGDSATQFCIQSCSKVISYLIGLKQFGRDYVHTHVGTEPSGQKFNQMVLKDSPTEENSTRQIPHNPMINAGAIMSVSMVYPEVEERSERLARVLDTWKQLSGGASAEGAIGYDDETYRSESSTADRNWCLGYMMKEKGAWPACFHDRTDNSLEETLELYFQICSVLSTSDCMANMAATLANGGLCPLTGERVFSADDVRCALPLMLTCGMYDYSGQWAYEIGVPAKSGVGGCVFMVIPNVCGIAVWSPRLDDIGNSVRGVHTASELVKHFAFHNFEVFSGMARNKIDVTMRKNAAKQAALGDVLYAASQGDVASLQASLHAGVDLFGADYDARTALHLAASEGFGPAVRFLVDNVPEERKASILSAKDRWGGTPLGDAVHSGAEECAAILREAGAEQDSETFRSGNGDGDGDGDVVRPEMSPDAPTILFAAAEGDVDELVKLNAGGHAIHSGDYDARTALHLAASEGHVDALRYLLTHTGEHAKARVIGAVDRWGATALDDAVREGHKACSDLLEAAATQAEP